MRSFHFKRKPVYQWVALTLLGASLAQPLSQAQTPAGPALNLPSLGDAGAADLPVAQERRLGVQIMRHVRRDADYFEDPLLSAYVQGLWWPLLDSARARGDLPPELDSALAWETFLVRQRSLNAFALPGGYVGVHLGLIASTQSGDELAAVLAHELAHVTQRHIARGMGEASRQAALGWGAMILGVLAASQGNGQAAQAAIFGGQALALQGQINFTRDMEREADRMGFGVFQQAGFAPEGMAGMFARLEHASRLNDDGSLPYLRTHPLTTERLAEAQMRLSGTPTGSPGAAASDLHALMQGRAQVWAETRTEAWQRLVTVAQQPLATQTSSSSRLAALYAGALAASQLRQFDLAAQLWSQVQGQLRDPSVTPLMATLKAELEIQAGQLAQAWQTLAQASAPASRPPWDFRRSELLLKADLLWRWKPGASPGERGLSQEALTRERATVAASLQGLLAQASADAPAWGALARLSEPLQRPLLSLRAYAEQQFALGNVDAALARLRQAQALSTQAQGAEWMEASVIDARARQWQSVRLQWLEDLRTLR